MARRSPWALIIVAIVVAALIAVAFAVSKIREWTFYPG
jgi:hypothetical protein